MASMLICFASQKSSIGESLMFSLNAILPIILLIVLGYFLKRIKLVNANFLSIANKLCFNVFLPCMLFMNIYKIDDLSNIDWNFILYGVIAIFVIFLLGLLYVVFFVKDNRQKGVVLQCWFRSNYAIIGISLATSLFQDAGASAASLLSAFAVPVFNVLAVISLSVFVKKVDDNGVVVKVNFGKVLLDIIKNPLIIGVALGLVSLLIRGVLVSNGINFRLTDIPFALDVVNKLGVVTTPLALIVLGGQFVFSQASTMWKQILVSTLARTVIVPVLGLVCAFLIMPNLPPQYVASYIALFASPVAVSSAIMAKEMQNDDILAGQLVFWTTIVSGITLFIFIFVFRQIGIFPI
ncbi:MAG: AEC family transporter [Clostridia bacterium]